MTTLRISSPSDLITAVPLRAGAASPGSGVTQCDQHAARPQVHRAAATTPQRSPIAATGVWQVTGGMQKA